MQRNLTSLSGCRRARGSGQRTRVRRLWRGLVVRIQDGLHEVTFTNQNQRQQRASERHGRAEQQNPIQTAVEADETSMRNCRPQVRPDGLDDRRGPAKELHDLLESLGVSVWFSEKDVVLGSPLLREIDKGLAKSRVGIVLVTPALLRRLQGEGIADKELSALLARDLLVPVVHDTTYEALREVSPLLGSRSGLNTAEDAMADVAGKLAELVAL